jgi:hypothetical protein
VLRTLLLPLALVFAAGGAGAQPAGGDYVLRVGCSGTFGSCGVVVCRGHAMASALVATAAHRRPWREAAFTLTYSVEPREIGETFPTWMPDVHGGRVFDRGGVVVVYDHVPGMGYVVGGVLVRADTARIALSILLYR